MKKAKIATHVTEEIRLPIGSVKALSARAAQLGMSLEDFIVYAMVRHLDDRTPIITESVGGDYL